MSLLSYCGDGVLCIGRDRLRPVMTTITTQFGGSRVLYGLVYNPERATGAISVVQGCVLGEFEKRAPRTRFGIPRQEIRSGASQPRKTLLRPSKRKSRNLGPLTSAKPGPSGLQISRRRLSVAMSFLAVRRRTIRLLLIDHRVYPGPFFTSFTWTEPTLSSAHCGPVEQILAGQLSPFHDFPAV